MNRIDRLLAMVLELQAKKSQRAEDLAATFEISKRTVYRDMLALMEMGIPVVSMPGVGYTLVEGYFLPPLTFNADEAIMLLLGGDFVAQHFDAQYRSAAQTAVRKISAVLPEKLRAEVADLERSIRFIADDARVSLDMLAQIRRAIIGRHVVAFDYQARFGATEPGEITHRDADPYALTHVGETWYMTAYCHLRHDIRNFRLNRIQVLKVSSAMFVRPVDLDLTIRDQSSRSVTIRALFDVEAARWVQESPSYFQIDAHQDAAGWLVTLKVRQIDEVLGWLLGWGSRVRVLDPADLRAKIAAEAIAVRDLYVSGGR